MDDIHKSMILPWKRLESTSRGDYAIFSVRRDQSRSPRSGKDYVFYVIESNDWVNVVPVTPEGKVVCVRQYRHGTREVFLEIPGGIVDSGESAAEAAKREMREETGYGCSQLIHLGSIAPNPAIQDNQCDFYLALDAKKETAQILDSAEDIEVVLIDQNEIPSLIAEGAINSGIMVAAFHYFALHQSGLINGHRQ